MWGIIPAAGLGTRVQPLAFSKELLPVGGQGGAVMEQPRAVSEYIVERMVLAGVTKVCFVISPAKSDILHYYSTREHPIDIFYVVQPKPLGLCDAIFRALPLIPAEALAVVGLPDTIWFPAGALRDLGTGTCSFLLFPSEQPELFDAVLTDGDDGIVGIYSKCPAPPSRWIWGAFQMSGSVLRRLAALWQERGRHDQYIGPLMNEFLKRGGCGRGVRAGKLYMDVGTLRGYRDAMAFVMSEPPNELARAR